MKTTRYINKDTVAKRFLKGGKTYDSHAKVQQCVSKLLVEKLKKYETIRFDKVFEIGCCTGNLTELLLENFPIKELYINDIVPEFFDTVVTRLGTEHNCKVHPQFGDIEKIAFPREVDTVISSATFQWLSNIEKLFVSVAESLRDKGFFAFSIFGPGTLREFREITNIGLNYLSVGTILDMLERYFYIEEEETVKDTLFFPTPFDVLKHLQATGVGGVSESRWTKRKLNEFEEKYYSRFGGTSGVPVTYMSSYIVATKK